MIVAVIKNILADACKSINSLSLRAYVAPMVKKQKAVELKPFT